MEEKRYNTGDAPVVPSKYCPPESSRIISLLVTSLQVSVTALEVEWTKGRKVERTEEWKDNLNDIQMKIKTTVEMFPI